MAPTKAAAPKPLIPSITTRITTRSKSQTTLMAAKGKRKADASPTKLSATKRSAFGDMTNKVVKALDENAAKKLTKPLAKKVTVHSKVLPSVKTVAKAMGRQSENVAPPALAHKAQTRQAAALKVLPVLPNQTAQKPKEVLKENVAVKVKTRLSNEFEKGEESLYSSALEDINLSSRSSTGRKNSFSSSTSTTSSTASATAAAQNKMSVTVVAHQLEEQLLICGHGVPEGVDDFDKENWDDLYQVSHYAMEIFDYLKTREPMFKPCNYMTRQTHLTCWMRSLLVDWMVEIQESFELNHETLYLGVKLVDLYLSKVMVRKESLQLVGAASMFIASKYDERIPPLVDDFLYICDGAYARQELLRMEMSVLKVVNFDLGMPLSYRFLRRYARASKVTMPLLTLARYILEYSLMDYATMAVSESKMAAACLYLALRMKKTSGWTPTLEYYTGYKLEDIIQIVHDVNTHLTRKPRDALMTVRTKYSHKIFFEVAKTPLLSNDDLKV